RRDLYLPRQRWDSTPAFPCFARTGRNGRGWSPMGAERRGPPPDIPPRPNSQKPLFLWIPKTVSFSGREKEMGFESVLLPRHSEAAGGRIRFPRLCAFLSRAKTGDTDSSLRSE